MGYEIYLVVVVTMGNFVLTKKRIMVIKADFYGGETIENAFKEAVRIANLLKCDIEFDFNGVTCIAYPNGDISNGIKDFYSAFKKEGLKMAFAK